MNIPRFYCLLRKEFFCDGQSHFGEIVKVCVFAVSSVCGRARGFHVLIEHSEVIWRLLNHSLCHKADAPKRPLDWLQLWDSFRYEVACTVFERLADCRVRVQLRDKSREGGQELFTIDRYGHEDAKEAGDGGHKCAHIMALDDGNFAAQPHNRVQWFCPAFVTPFKEKPDYVTNTSVWKVERETEKTTGFFYDDVRTPDESSQVRLHAKGLRVDSSRFAGPTDSKAPEST